MTSPAHIIQPQNYSRFRYTEVKRNTSEEYSGGALSGRPIYTRVTSPNERARTINEMNENSITKHINGGCRDRDDDGDDYEDGGDDFEQYVKCFYLGGFLPSVMWHVIAKNVT